MFQTLSVSFTAVLSVACVIYGGFLLRRFGVLTKESDQGLLRLMINFLMPCLILDRVLFHNVFADPRNLYYPALLGAAVITVGILLAACVGFLPGLWTGLDTRAKRGTFATCTGLLNYGYVPIALITFLFPESTTTMGVLFIVGLGVEFTMWTLGLLMIQGKFDWNSVKKSINGPTVTILLAIPLNLWVYGHYYPAAFDEMTPYFAFLKEAIRLVGKAAIPLSIILVGASIGDVFRAERYRTGLKETLKVVFWACLLRNLILPTIILFTAYYLPCTVELKRVLVLHAAMGAAMFPIVLAQHYDGDSDVALDTILSTSFLSIITSPLWIAFGLQWVL
ncbi:MAG: AEC family transporter [Planctomycetaceae bacterium]|nr:AEC family transporter [Planctomycetaceae bacterium]